MEVLFSEGWAKHFTNKWNKNSEIVKQLAAANFDAIVAFGFTDSEPPAVSIEIKNGTIIKAQIHSQGALGTPQWDLRANLEQWEKWRGNGPGIGGLGVAIANKQLQFRAGDYRKMIRQPMLAGPFLKFFDFL